jgi:hypothetical protein
MVGLLTGFDVLMAKRVNVILTQEFRFKRRVGSGKEPNLTNAGV